jgi:hypothetical protein
MVTRMDALFWIDRDARRRALSAQERLVQQSEYAEDWLHETRQACLGLLRESLPKSALGKPRPTP